MKSNSLQFLLEEIGITKHELMVRMKEHSLPQMIWDRESHTKLPTDEVINLFDKVQASRPHQEFFKNFFEKVRESHQIDKYNLLWIQAYREVADEFIQARI